MKGSHEATCQLPTRRSHMTARSRMTMYDPSYELNEAGNGWWSSSYTQAARLRRKLAAQTLGADEFTAVSSCLVEYATAALHIPGSPARSSNHVGASSACFGLMLTESAAYALHQRPDASLQSDCSRVLASWVGFWACRAPLALICPLWIEVPSHHSRPLQ